MLWLQDHDKYDQLCGIEPESGSIGMHSRAQMGDVAPRATVGSFTELSGLFVALYAHDGKLVLRAGDDTFDVDADTTVEVDGALPERQLVVKRHGKAIFSHQYAVDESQIIAGDDTAFVDEEDYDFGLWLANVSRNPERKQVLLDPDGSV